MKKFFALMLVLAVVFALAACGETKTAEVVENVDPGSNPVVIETPPAIVSGPDTPADQYPTVSSLPTTAPTTVPDAEATAVPIPGSEPDGTGTSPEGVNPVVIEDGEHEPITYADDNGQDYDATATQQEKNNAKIAYINAEWVNFRVGPGTQYKIYESLPRGAMVKVLGYTDNGWAKIWYNDYLVGFVAKNYLSANKPVDAVIIVTEAPNPTDTPAPSVVVIG